MAEKSVCGVESLRVEIENAARGVESLKAKLKEKSVCGVESLHAQIEEVARGTEKLKSGLTK
jgi:predicted aspartyl protease